jgi:hypothetical protein
MRLRHLFIIFSLLFVTIGLLLTDPSLGLIEQLKVGAPVISIILITGSTVYYIIFAYFVRRAFHDYEVGDIELLGKKATLTPEGAGLYAIAMAIFFFAYVYLIAAAIS